MDAYDHMFQFSEPARTKIVVPRNTDRKLPPGGGVFFWTLICLPVWIIAGVAFLAWMKTH